MPIDYRPTFGAADVLAILRSPEGRAAISEIVQSQYVINRTALDVYGTSDKFCRPYPQGDCVARVVAVEPGGMLQVREDDWDSSCINFRARPESVRWLTEKETAEYVAQLAARVDGVP